MERVSVNEVLPGLGRGTGTDGWTDVPPPRSDHLSLHKARLRLRQRGCSCWVLSLYQLRDLRQAAEALEVNWFLKVIK